MERSQGSLITVESLVRDHWRAVLALCLARTPSLADAEDAAQETMGRAIARLGSLRDPAKIRAWLFQIARRVCSDFARRRRPIQSLTDQAPAPDRAADPRLEQLQMAITRLPLPYREVITLYYLDGHSTAEVAATLGFTPAAVRQRLTRARLMLHKLMAEDRT